MSRRRNHRGRKFHSSINQRYEAIPKRNTLLFDRRKHNRVLDVDFISPRKKRKNNIPKWEITRKRRNYGQKIGQYRKRNPQGRRENFNRPEHLAEVKRRMVCHTRKEQRISLFATGKAGSGVKIRTPKLYTEDSNTRC